MIEKYSVLLDPLRFPVTQCRTFRSFSPRRGIRRVRPSCTEQCLGIRDRQCFATLVPLASAYPYFKSISTKSWTSSRLTAISETWMIETLGIFTTRHPSLRARTAAAASPDWKARNPHSAPLTPTWPRVQTPLFRSKCGKKGRARSPAKCGEQCLQHCQGTPQTRKHTRSTEDPKGPTPSKHI